MAVRSQYHPRERMDPARNADASTVFALTHLLTQVVLTSLPRLGLQFANEK